MEISVKKSEIRMSSVLFFFKNKKAPGLLGPFGPSPGSGLRPSLAGFAGRPASETEKQREKRRKREREISSFRGPPEGQGGVPLPYPSSTPLLTDGSPRTAQLVCPSRLGTLPPVLRPRHGTPFRATALVPSPLRLQGCASAPHAPATSASSRPSSTASSAPPSPSGRASPRSAEQPCWPPPLSCPSATRPAEQGRPVSRSAGRSVGRPAGQISENIGSWL